MRRHSLLSVLALFASACAGAQPPLRKEFFHEAVINAPPDVVFPLLCPIREKEWIEGWDARVLISSSGVAEENAMFETRLVFGETWVTTRYEPEQHRVEYTIFAGGHAVLRLDLALAALPDGTTRWSTRRTYTGLDFLGRRSVARISQREMDEAQATLARQLAHFLAEGTKLTSK